jgi:hypothetical protein
MANQWLVPWLVVDTDAERRELESELQRELIPQHAMYGKSLIAIGRRQDCDDVLFQLHDGRVAIIHLTWIGKAERDRRWPRTRIFESWQQFEVRQMCPDHSTWEECE